MLTPDILVPERTLVTEQKYTKKTVLEFISQIFAQANPSLSAEEIYQVLNTRETLGSTALGHGVAIPHARISSVTSIMGSLIYCKHSVDFDALDGKPVDIIFALLVPIDAVDEHIKVLALVTKIFNDIDHREQIRKVRDDKSLFQIVNNFAAYS